MLQHCDFQFAVIPAFAPQAGQHGAPPKCANRVLQTEQRQNLKKPFSRRSGPITAASSAAASVFKLGVASAIFVLPPSDCPV